jgi:type II secretory pathway pseudopilin PulG
MNRPFITVVIAITAAVSIPAVAGRDAAQISQQEKANQAMAEQHAKEEAKAGKAATRIVLPLDHGPHAQTTPWVNKQRLLRAAAMEKGRAATGTPEK